MDRIITTTEPVGHSVTAEAPVETLLEIVRRHGTPAYAYDVRRLRAQVETLRTQLPAEVSVYYSLKANASLGICDVFAACGLGADVASAGELATAIAAGFPADRIFVAGPFKSRECVDMLRSLPEAIVSIDSVSEWSALARAGLRNRAVLRLRPDFGSHAVVTAGADSRFGIPLNELPRCREHVGSGGMELIGFHVFAGSQVLDADGVVGHLRGAAELSLKAAEMLGVVPSFLDLGGGFGIPYRASDEELPLGPIRDELERLLERVRPARLALELGRYLVAQAGWYLTSVLGHQTHRGRPAVVVDGGTHQRADLCGIGLRQNANPPLVLGRQFRGDADALRPTDVLGSLSLPADVLAEAALLPALSPGDLLAFANAGAYGLWSSPAIFHGSPLPAEVAFDASTIELMRPPQAARSILDGQCHVRPTSWSTTDHTDSTDQCHP